MQEPGTVVVQVKAASTSARAAPTSRIRIAEEVYDAEIALAKEEERPPKYLLEGDQDCEGPSTADAVKARDAQKAEATA